MKAKPLKRTDTGYVGCSIEEVELVQLNIPGPISTRIIPVILSGPRKGTGNWSWNGDVDKPTLKPSILTDNGEGGIRCHSFVNDGMVKFLADCSHEFAGQTLPLFDVDS